MKKALYVISIAIGVIGVVWVINTFAVMNTMKAMYGGSLLDILWNQGGFEQIMTPIIYSLGFGGIIMGIASHLPKKEEIKQVNDEENGEPGEDK